MADLLLQFSHAYVFKKESVLRTRVTKFENGVRGKTYLLLGDSCSCPAMIRSTATCKHQKMWQGNYVKDDVNGKLFMGFVKVLAESLSLPFDIPDPLPGVVSMARLELKKDILSGADLVILEKDIAGKTGVIELRKKIN